MSAPDPIANLPDAVSACAADADVSPASVRTVRVDAQYKSSVAFLATRPGDDITHVLKLDPAGVAAGRWDPAREHAGLRHAAGQLGDHEHGERQNGIGAIPPVGHGDHWLLTRFVAGTSARPTFDRALSRPWATGARTRAHALAERAAEWLRLFREGGEPDGGLQRSDMLEFLAERTREIAEHANAHGAAERALAGADALAGAVPDSALQRRYPTHGDFAPQNLHVTPAGRLYVLDFEGFAVRPLDADLARFRMRLEHAALRAPWARRHAAALWRTFAAERFGGPPRADAETAAFGALCYVHWLIGHLAWLSLPAELAPARSPEGRTTAIRTGLWRRNRIRWLERLPGNAAEAAAYCARVL